MVRATGFLTPQNITNTFLLLYSPAAAQGIGLGDPLKLFFTGRRSNSPAAAPGIGLCDPIKNAYNMLFYSSLAAKATLV
jgi:hypothetical protein